MNSFEEEMAEFASQWDDAETQTGAGSLPEGVYQAKIKVARVEKSDWDTWQLFLVFEDLNGAGEQRMWYNLEHKVGAALAKGICLSLGWEDAAKPRALLQLEKVCASGFFLDKVVEIRVKDKQGEDKVFKQVFINKLLGHAASAEVASGDDIPF